MTSNPPELMHIPPDVLRDLGHYNDLATGDLVIGYVSTGEELTRISCADVAASPEPDNLFHDRICEALNIDPATGEQKGD